MRGRIVLATAAALAMAIAAPRDARCSEQVPEAGLILTLAAAGAGAADLFRVLTRLFDFVPSLPAAGMIEDIFAGPQLEVGGDGGMRLSVLPTFSSLGSLHQTGVAVAGRF